MLLRVFRALSPDPEQVIEVPKILPEDVSLRTAVREPQLAEQLVEVPTIVSFSWLQLGMEQNVDIPVPGRGGRLAGLQGSLPGQSSTERLLLSGSLTFLVEVLKVLALDRVRQRLLLFILQLDRMMMRMGLE